MSIRSMVVGVVVAVSLAACGGEVVGVSQSGLSNEESAPPPSKACPAIMFDCADGHAPADSDGDGCVDSCQPKNACDPAILCKEGFEEADFDGDRCVDSCKPKACPAIMIDCVEGHVPADADGDGCVDSCAPAE